MIGACMGSRERGWGLGTRDWGLAGSWGEQGCFETGSAGVRPRPQYDIVILLLIHVPTINQPLSDMKAITSLLLLVITSGCASAQSPCPQIVYELPDEVQAAIEKGVAFTERGADNFISVGEEDGGIMYVIRGRSIYPDDMREWVESSNRVIRCGEYEISLYFEIEYLMVTTWTMDFFGGYVVLADKEGKVTRAAPTQ